MQLPWSAAASGLPAESWQGLLASTFPGPAWKDLLHTSASGRQSLQKVISPPFQGHLMTRHAECMYAEMHMHTQTHMVGLWLFTANGNIVSLIVLGMEPRALCILGRCSTLDYTQL